MEDLLGIECTSNPDGSITLHQSKYIDSMISRFFTADERQKFKKTSTCRGGSLPAQLPHRR